MSGINKAQINDEHTDLCNSPAMYSFHEREKIMLRGLRRYLKNVIGEYLDNEEQERIVKMLTNFRFRPSDVVFSKNLCICVSAKEYIPNRYIPMKKLRKDEVAILMYNLSPYALLSRNHTAIMAKYAFPNFFATVGTINSTFTKYLNSSVTNSGRPLSLVISNLPHHSTAELEMMFYNLGIK